MSARPKGFTLIELLVTIAIIAVLVSIGVAGYTSVGQKARDSSRKQDLKAISQALEVYYQVNRRYPRTGASYQLSSTGGVWIKDTVSGPDLDSTYIATIPTDPRPSGGNPITDPNGSQYAYWAGVISGSNCPADAAGQGGQFYILAAKLEDTSDSERNSVKSYTNCANSLIASPATYPNVYIITSTF